MSHTISASQGKVKLSGAVKGWTVAVLEKFRRDAGLKTRSAALCEALDQWAREYSKESALEKALVKYGKAYSQVAESEERCAQRTLPLLRRTRGLP